MTVAGKMEPDGGGADRGAHEQEIRDFCVWLEEERRKSRAEAMSAPQKSAPPSEPKGQWMLIGPEQAQRILDFGNKRNRRLRRSWVNALSADARAGQWREEIGIESPIIIDRRGNVKEGQHRMAMVVQTGLTLWFWIIFEVDEDLPIMTGNPRSVADIIRLTCGKTMPVGWEAWVPLYKYIWRSRGGRGGTQRMEMHTATVREMESGLRRHAASLAFACEHLANPPDKMPGIATAPIRATIARAHANLAAKNTHKAPCEDIVRFCATLRDGKGLEERDVPVLLLRNWIVRAAYRAIAGRRATGFRTESYRRTEKAIADYCAGCTAKRLPPAAKKELFPVEEDSLRPMEKDSWQPNIIPTGTVNSIRALARAVGRSRQAVEKWIRGPRWPFGPQGPWDVQAILVWAGATLQPDRSAGGIDEPENKKSWGVKIPWHLLSARSRERLTEIGCKVLGDITRFTEAELLAGENFGETSLNKVKRLLRGYGLCLAKEAGGP